MKYRILTELSPMGPVYIVVDSGGSPAGEYRSRRRAEKRCAILNGDAPSAAAPGPVRSYTHIGNSGGRTACGNTVSQDLIVDERPTCLFCRRKL